MAHREETYRLFVLMAHHEKTLAFGLMAHSEDIYRLLVLMAHREETYRLFVLMDHHEQTLDFYPRGPSRGDVGFWSSRLTVRIVFGPHGPP